MNRFASVVVVVVDLNGVFDLNDEVFILAAPPEEYLAKMSVATLVSSSLCWAGRGRLENHR